MADFQWDKRAQQYRWMSGDRSGKFVSRAKVASLTEKYIKQSKDRAANIVDALLDEDITLRQFEAGFARVIKFAHINSYSLGLGGTMRYEHAKDKGIIGAKVKAEYKYLRGFTRDIRDGKLSKAQIRARANLYLNSLYTSLERGRNEGHKRNGFLWERDIRSAAESCSSCIDIAARGWVEIGSNPPIGVDRECKANCRCHKDYSRKEEKPEVSTLIDAVNSSLKSSFGWICANVA